MKTIAITADWRDVDGLINQLADAFTAVGGRVQKDSEGRVWFSAKRLNFTIDETDEDWMKTLLVLPDISWVQSADEVDDIIGLFDSAFDELGYDLIEDEAGSGSDTYMFNVQSRD